MTVNINCAIHMLFILLFVTFYAESRHFIELMSQKVRKVPKLMLMN